MRRRCGNQCQNTLSSVKMETHETVNVKRARKLNWSQAEVDELRNSYLEFRSVIDGRLGVTLTNYQKEQTWRGIQERINAQSKETRTLDEIKKKLSDMKTSIKKKERERRQLSSKTGGGPAPILNEQDEKMIEAIGEVAVGGFEGVDTFSISVETAATEERPFLIDQTSYATDKRPIFIDQTSEGTLQGTSANVTDAKKYSQSNKKRKSNADDDGDKIMSILEDQTQVLKQILEEQRKTNKILSQLFAVNAEP